MREKSLDVSGVGVDFLSLLNQLPTFDVKLPHQLPCSGFCVVSSCSCCLSDIGGLIFVSPNISCNGPPNFCGCGGSGILPVAVVGVATAAGVGCSGFDACMRGGGVGVGTGVLVGCGGSGILPVGFCDVATG